MADELKTFEEEAEGKNNSSSDIPTNSETISESVKEADIASEIPQIEEPKPETAIIDNTDFSDVDPLLKEQKNQVDQMRSTLLSFNKNDMNSAKRAIQNITVLRIYHQIARIIKFTEMMDLLEDKLYESMIANIGEMDSYDPTTMLMLMKVQSQLQETMVQSQQLIKPYLDMDLEAIAPAPELEDTSFGVAIIPQESRNNIRVGAQALLTELKKANPNLPEDENTPDDTDVDAARTE